VHSSKNSRTRKLRIVDALFESASSWFAKISGGNLVENTFAVMRAIIPTEFYLLLLASGSIGGLSKSLRVSFSDNL